MFFNKWCWKIWIYTRRKLDFYLSSFTKISSKWIKDLNGRPETLRQLGANLGEKTRKILRDVVVDKDFLIQHPENTGNKSKNRLRGFHQTK